MSRPPLPQSHWVIDGEFLAGAYPLELQAPGDRAKPLERLLKAGIDCFINLTAPDECPDYRALLPEDVLHFRKTLAENGQPARPEDMQDIQALIAAQLAAGRRIYLHCRAGVGRTNTVVGCYLVEQGYAGREALDELNRLWQQNVLSRSRTEMHEHPEQNEYVIGWPKFRRPQPLLLAATGAAPLDAQAPDPGLRLVGSLRERYLGAMVGMAVGDALAAATQFRRRGSFTPIGDMLGGGPYDLPRGGWSDDTAVALCLAESLVEKHDFDAEDFMARLLRWQSEGHRSATGQCVGITGAMARALSGSPAGVRPTSHETQQEPEALCRVAPAVLHQFADPARAVALAAEVARVSGDSPSVIDSCRLLAVMLHAALRGAARERLLCPDLTDIAPPPLRRDVSQLTAAVFDEPLYGGRDPVGAEALDVLQAVRWALATTTNFRDGALAAINLGGHSDVVGAVYGQLAGAHYGLHDIPAHWRSALLHRADIEALADELLADALVSLSQGEGRE